LKQLQTNDRVALLDQLAKGLVEQWKDMGYFQTCLNCSYFQQNPANEYEYRCDKFNSVPPPRILIVGCESHSDNIPF
jgi:hypothetical protein